MNKLILDRRDFLLGAGACLMSQQLQASAQRGDVLFASAFESRSGDFGLAVLNELGEIIYQHELPARGHGIAANEYSTSAVIFARRPGNFALSFDPTNQNEPHIFTTPINRHFYGHGTFSKDGKLLFASENDFEHERGVIGIYDGSNNFQRAGEFSSGGIGPHEIILLSDQRTLCVANGGIKTHPQFPRTKLNLDEMQSNIAFIDSQSGELKATHSVHKKWSRLSLRHMASDQDGKVWIGGQYEGNAFDQAPLIANVSPGEPLAFVELPAAQLNGLQNYIGSVALNKGENLVSFTSPKGGQLLLLDSNNGSIVSSQTLRGTNGVAPTDIGFVSSSESGRFGSTNHHTTWDNHIGKLV